ncbi:MAG TPA: LysM peptidoglycan-binding domain-containing protein [Chloroflexia bacterium]|nr:LysM peptidoglycan-binding domain-containing protein [Chloroflexia bacterium]
MQNRVWGWLALIALLAGLLAVVRWVGQTTPALTIYVDLGFGTGATPTSVAVAVPQVTAPPSLLPASQTPAVAGAPLPTLPAAGTIVQHTIQQGDTLSGIAARYGTTVQAIQARNGIANPNLLFIGSPLQIMVGEQPTAVAAVPVAPTMGPETGAAPPTPAPLPGPAGPIAPAAMNELQPTRPAQPPAAYTVYIPTANKTGQWFHFTCEFDAAWAIFKTHGLDVSLDDQLQIIGVDNSVTPSYKQTAQGVEIYGGDIANHYSGDYKTNFLARTTGSAMQKVFEHYGFATTPVRDQAGVEAALQAGNLIWIKTTVDFQRWVPATWIGPDGRRYPTVLGNDHAVVVAGYNADAVLIRDVLGPTSTNANRLTEYEVAWPTFLAAWGAQGYDGVAVASAATGP